MALIPTARRTAECSPSAATNHFTRTPVAVTPVASCSTPVIRAEIHSVSCSLARAAKAACSVVRRTPRPGPRRKCASARRRPLTYAMPRNGRPAGSTSSEASSARPPGISPSPHALSIGSSRGSATITESPRRRACNAAANPPGPPPAISRSASYIAQRFVLDPDPHPQQQRVGHGESEGGQPCRVHQRQGHTFGHHRHIVRVMQPAVGTTSHQRLLRQHDHQSVPPTAQSRHAPPAQGLAQPHHDQHRPAEPAEERPVQRPHLHPAADQQRGMHGNHYRIVAATKLLAAVGKSPLRVALGDDQLNQPFDADRQDQQVVHAYQPSSTSSEQNAGPMAIINPNEPGGGGSAMLARSTSRTDTDDRLPLTRNEFRV